MNTENFSTLTDQELLDKYKTMKSNVVTNAVLIGFLFGILLYSILVNSIGFLSLIPLFLLFKLLNNSTQKKSLESTLKERKLM